MFLEGGVADVDGDYGGLTKYGITEKRYPTEDIRALTPERAQYLYKRDFWDKYKIESYPEEYRYLIFDMYVNHSPRTVVKIIQRAINDKIGHSEWAKSKYIKVDGIIGPQTLWAFKKYKPSVNTILAYRLDKFNDLADDLPKQNQFRVGWTNRIFHLNDFIRGFTEITEEYILINQCAFKAKSLPMYREEILKRAS